MVSLLDLVTPVMRLKTRVGTAFSSLFVQEHYWDYDEGNLSTSDDNYHELTTTQGNPAQAKGVFIYNYGDNKAAFQTSSGKTFTIPTGGGIDFATGKAIRAKNDTAGANIKLFYEYRW